MSEKDNTFCRPGAGGDRAFPCLKEAGISAANADSLSGAMGFL
jgi:hypothetical protein